MKNGFGTSISIKRNGGPLTAIHYRSDKGEALVITHKPWGQNPILRIHSACILSESIGTSDCDCASQLTSFLDKLAAESGALVYLFQEGRGIGLRKKFEAVALQQAHNLDTVEAFSRLGFPADPRTYDVALEVLEQVDFPKSVRFATNNPSRIELLRNSGYNVERLDLHFKKNPDMNAYLEMKRNCLGHDTCP
jgi:GTP cyclohydrolase II